MYFKYQLRILIICPPSRFVPDEHLRLREHVHANDIEIFEKGDSLADSAHLQLETVNVRGHFRSAPGHVHLLRQIQMHDPNRQRFLNFRPASSKQIQ